MTEIKKKIIADYDKSADVLYLTIGSHFLDRCEEDEAGLIWIYDFDNVVYGVTITDFREFWSERKADLAHRIRSNLNVPEKQILRVLQN